MHPDRHYVQGALARLACHRGPEANPTAANRERDDDELSDDYLVRHPHGMG